MKTNKKFYVLTIALVVFVVVLTGCTKSNTTELQTKIESLENELDKYNNGKALTEYRLAVFDTLGYDFYGNQKWEDFNHRHAIKSRFIILMEPLPRDCAQNILIC